MKNLFDFATKELSQDAFLRWLFESHKEPEMGDVVRKMLEKFCDIKEEIEKIVTRAQEKHIDIKVEITTKGGRRVFLFIEDKVFSSEHKQLSRYDVYINGLAEECYKLFYKANVIGDEDRNGLGEANKLNRSFGKPEWQICDIDDILALLEQEERLIEKLKSGDSGFICKRIVRTKKGKPIFPKQIGYTEELPARTTEELILQIEKLASKYLELLKEW